MAAIMDRRALMGDIIYKMIGILNILNVYNKNDITNADIVNNVDGRVRQGVWEHHSHSIAELNLHFIHSLHTIMYIWST